MIYTDGTAIISTARKISSPLNTSASKDSSAASRNKSAPKTAMNDTNEN